MTIDTGFFIHNGHRVYYHRAGNPLKKKIIFLHNGTMWHGVWEKQLNDLSKDYEVFAFDYLRHGKSDKPNVDHSIDVHLETLETLINHFNIKKFSLSGICVGAAVAMKYSILNKDKVEKLILFSVTPGRLITQNILGQNLFKILSKLPFIKNILFKLFGNILPKLIDQSVLPRILFGKKINKEDNIYKELERIYNDKDIYRLRFDMIFHANDYTVNEYVKNPGDLPERLLFWGGMNKLVDVKIGEHIRDIIKPKEFIIYPEAGHLLIYENANEINYKIKEFVGTN